MLDGLMKMGVTPVVFVPNREGIFSELEKRGIPVFAFTFRMYTYSHTETLTQKLLFIPRMVAKVMSNQRAINALVPILKKHKIDIVHTNVGPVNVGFRASRRLGIPHVYHLREYGKKDFGMCYFPRWKNFYEQFETDNSYSICITRDIQAYHQQQGKSTSVVIYNGICTENDKIPLITGSKDYFLFAGRLEAAKGVDSMLEAYSLYVDRTTHPLPLRVAGSIANSIYVERLKSIVVTHHIQAYVEFLGDCLNVDELMRGARATIIPSLHEAFGRVMPEAMMQGCLCIGRNTSGTKEQLDNGLRLTGEEIGLRYSTAEELAEWLEKVGEAPQEQFRPYTERAFKVVNQLYTKENNSKQIYEFYQEILNGQGTHGIN